MNRATRAFIIFLTVALLFFNNLSIAEDDDSIWHSIDSEGRISINLHFFWSVACPRCKQAHPFIEHLGEKYPWLNVQSYDVRKDPENLKLYINLALLINQKAQSVPAFMFCKEIHTGYDNDKTTGNFLEQRLLECYNTVKASTVKKPIAEKSLSLPIIGRIDPSALSLPVFTFLIAAMDAFNPCAFFVLLFLLSLLVHARSRTHMFIIGGIFVFFSGIIYFLFMAAWLNVFLIMGKIEILTIIAGAFAVMIGVVNIKDYFWFKAGLTLSIPSDKKPALYKRMRNLVRSRSMPAMMIGAVMLSIVANSYELLCTAGFPMVYTRVLTLNNLHNASHYLYLAFYNIIYVIPLVLIVLVFTITLGNHKLSEKEGRILKLTSGLMMLGLGSVLLIDPELLNNLFLALGLLVSAVGITVIVEVRKRILTVNKKISE